MSRIGKKPITLPDKVKLNVSGEGAVHVKGPKGKLSWTLPPAIKARVEGTNVIFDRKDETRQVRALHGLSRALVSNMVAGVSNGFAKELEIQGVGFKAAVQGDKLNLSLGFSHAILFSIPKGIKITVTENTKIRIEGADKQDGRAGRRRYPRLLPAGALQGQGRPLRRRAGPPQGRQNRPVTPMAALNRKQKTAVRHTRLRKTVVGTAERPRLSVHFSAKNIYAQVIDDSGGVTIASANTTEGDFKTDKKTRANKETAGKVGRLVAERTKARKVSRVVFDRGGLQYPWQGQGPGRRRPRRRPRILTLPNPKPSTITPFSYHG